MKRYGNLYEKIYDYENLKLAFNNAKRGKTWYEDVKEIENNLDYYLIKLQNMLISKTYITSEYEIFKKLDKGKEREIYKLPFFPDRVCQWAVLQIIEPILVSKFISNTFSAIPNRGIHLALGKILHDTQKDKEGTKYCLKFDIKKYYPSIDHEVLKNMLKKIFKDKDLLWLLYEIIDSIDSGIPIGNYLSQYMGNFYKTYFEHWLKEVKKCKYLYVYMDDYVILNSDKNFLHNLKRECDEYLYNNLKLVIKNSWQVFPTYVRGIDFVGYRIFDNYVLLRKSIAKSYKKKLRKFLKQDSLSDGNICTVSSYKGWLKWCNCYNLNNTYELPLKAKFKE